MNVEEKVFEVLKKILFPDSPVSNSTLAKDKTEEWDSLKHITIVSELEEEFNIQFEPEEIVQMDSSKKIVNIVNRKIKK